MTENTKKRRGAGFLLLAAGLAAAFVVTLLIPGIAPWSPAPPPAVAATCEVTYYALDPANLALPNPNKESAGAFGPAIDARDEAGIKAELDIRRECGDDGTFDPQLVASHYAEWSEQTGLTSVTVASKDIDSFKSQLIADTDLRKRVVAELKLLEGESSFAVVSVPAGVWSLYSVPDGQGGVITKVGQTSTDGTNAEFTHSSGAVVKYRLDCGAQPNRPTPPPGVPECAPGECTPPPPVCPWNPTLPPDSPECQQPKDWDDNPPKPDDYVPLPEDGLEPRPGLPVDPAPVLPEGEVPDSDSQAPGATLPDPDREIPDPGTGEGGGSVNPEDGGPNDTDPGNPF